MAILIEIWNLFLRHRINCSCRFCSLILLASFLFLIRRNRICLIELANGINVLSGLWSVHRATGGVVLADIACAVVGNRREHPSLFKLYRLRRMCLCLHMICRVIWGVGTLKHILSLISHTIIHINITLPLVMIEFFRVIFVWWRRLLLSFIVTVFIGFGNKRESFRSFLSVWFVRLRFYIWLFTCLLCLIRRCL